LLDATAMLYDNFGFDESISVSSESENVDSEASSFVEPARCLAICELHHADIHGLTEESDALVTGHYLIIDHMDPHDCDEWREISEIHKRKYEYYKRNSWTSNGQPYHPVVRNYSNIISHAKYVQPEIVERVYLRGSECVAIIKTFWLKIIQRAWKRVFAQRKKMENMRFNPLNIHYWFVYGKWPESCNQLPSIHGIISR
jgi:hypothetical protein